LPAFCRSYSATFCPAVGNTKLAAVLIALDATNCAAFYASQQGTILSTHQPTIRAADGKAFIATEFATIRAALRSTDFATVNAAEFKAICATVRAADQSTIRTTFGATVG
jgi:hypothetical protein